MYTIVGAIHFLFPLIALILLIIGMQRNAIYYIISALWISLISLMIHLESSGGQLLGDSFDYLNAATYSINLLILIIAFIRVLSHLTIDNAGFRYLGSFATALIIIGSLLVVTNIWVNAYFIENRMEGTPIIQVATFTKIDYCNYQYIFYKVNKDGSVMYLCPNHYGLIPSVGHLAVSPDFIASQLSLPNKKHFNLLQAKGNIKS